MKYMFTCGGTAGHINPAIAVADRLKGIDKSADFLFIGANGMMETELVPLSGYPIKTVDVKNISRSLSFSGIKHNVLAICKVIQSTKEAKRIIKDFKPNVVIGTGGYVCYPVLKAAHQLGIPTLVHESNAVPGLTTKLLSNIVDCVLVGFESARENYSSRTNTVCIGTPVREEFGAMSKEEAKAKLGLPSDKPLLVSVWGSLGSGFINQLIPDISSELLQSESFQLIHSTGKSGFQKLTSNLPLSIDELKKNGIDIREYIYDMPLVMTAADLIACRSGASTLSELAYLGKPALLIPSPNVTNNHQEKNARMLEEQGAAVVVLENEINSKSLYSILEDLLQNEDKLKKMSDSMAKCGIKDATERFTNMILKYAKSK